MIFSPHIQKNNKLNSDLPLQFPLTEESHLPPYDLAKTEFFRAGDDLEIKTLDGFWTIHDYFINPVLIKTVNGMILSIDDVVAKLSYHTEPILLAANGTPNLVAGAEKIGTITVVIENVTAQSQDATTRSLSVGDPVYLHETILTVAKSYVKINLNDGTIFQLGPHSRARMEKYIYEPDESLGGEFETYVYSGSFRYISGKISGNNQGQHTTIKTPSAQINIRGSEIDAIIAADGSTHVLHLSGLINIIPHYRSEEILVFERGTSVYIPSENTAHTINRLTEDLIQQRGQEWEAVNRLESSEITLPESQEEAINRTEFEGTEEAISPSDKQAEEQENEREEEAPPPHIERNPFAPDNIDVNANQTVDELLPADGETKHGEHHTHTGQITPHPSNPVEPDEKSSDGKPPKPAEPRQDIIKDERTPEEVPPPSSFPKDVILDEDNAQIIPITKGNITQISQPAHGGVINNGDGTLTYTPTQHFHGDDRFTYILDGGDFVLVNLAIKPVNDAPVAEDDIANTTKEDTSLLLRPLENDRDIEGDILSIISFQGIDSTHGNVFQNDNGDFVYQPAPHFYGQTAFFYTMQDEQGASDKAKIIINVTPVNDDPVAIDDSIDIGDDTSRIISVASLLENDRDIDGDALQIINVLNPINGSVSLSDGEIFFSLNSPFLTSKFEYIVSDGNETDIGQVTLINNRVENLSPIANDDSLTTSSLTPITIGVDQLLSNDTDPENDSLNIIRVNDGGNGKVEFGDTADTIVFTPSSDFADIGSGDFSYVISDDQGNTASALVSVGFIPINQPLTALDDSVTTNNLAPITINAEQLLSNDSVSENDTLSIISVSDGSNGKVELDDDGDVIVFTPSSDFADIGKGDFSYVISDDQGNTTSALVSVTFNPSHQPLTALNDSVTTNNLTPITISAEQLLENDTDSENHTLSIISVSDGSNGKVELDDDGDVIVFTPSSDFADIGKGDFSYVISDDQGNTASALVSVTFKPSNLPPIAKDDGSFDMGNHDSMTFKAKDLLKNDNDPDNDPITINNIIKSVHGNAFIDVNGDVVFTRGTDFEGSGEFEYEISDGKGGTDTAIVSVTGNMPPIATDDDSFDMGSHDSIILSAVELLGNDSDPNGDQITLDSIIGNVYGNAIIDANGNIIFSRGLYFNGSGEFEYEISDGKGGTDTAVVSVTGNMLPIATDDSSFYMGNLDSISLNVEDLLRNDSDPDNDPITLNSIKWSVHGNANREANGEVVFTRGADFEGSGEFEYEISDGKGGTDTAIVSVTGNMPPIAIDDGSFEMSSFDSISISMENLLGNDSDPDHDPITFNAITGSVHGNAVIDANGNVVFTRGADFEESGEFGYQISDGRGGTDIANVIVTGIPHEAPIAKGERGSTFKNTPIEFSSLLDNDFDPDPDDKITISEVINPVGCKVNVNEAGNVVLTPEPGFVGIASFEYVIKDNHDVKSSPAQVEVEVINRSPDAVDDFDDPDVNDEPYLFRTEAGEPLSISIDNLLDNDSDPDPDDVITLVEDGIGEAQNGTIELVDDNVIFTPAEGFEGETSFTYQIQDSSGALDTATVTVMVTPPNEPPIANNDSGFRTFKNKAIVLSVLNNDYDPDKGDEITINTIDGVSIDVGNVLPVQNGEVELGGEGNDVIIFTPELDFIGIARFEYVIKDTFGATSSPAQVEIIVDKIPPPNIPPVAINDHDDVNDDPLLFSTKSGEPLSIEINNLLDNDYDPNGDSIYLSNLEEPQNSTVELIDDNVIFTPPEDFVGEASFKYWIVDSRGAQTIAPATVTITVEKKFAVDDVFEPFYKNTTDTISSASLLSNDNGEGLVITAVDNAEHGSAILLESGDVQFVAENGFEGDGGFEYTVTNSDEKTDKATVTVEIKNTPPEAVDDPDSSDDPLLFSTESGKPLSIEINNLLDNDTDPDGDVISLVKDGVGEAQNGTLVLSDEEVVFTPTPDFSGEASFEYTITDGDLEDTAKVNIAVTSIPPVITLSNSTSLEYNDATGEPVQIDSAATVMDPDSSDFDGGVLRTQIENRTPSDILEIQNIGSIAVSSGTSGEVKYDDKPIGNVLLNLFTGALSVNLNANADHDATSALLQAISYKNTEATPSTGIRAEPAIENRVVKITLTLSDGDGGESVPVSIEMTHTSPPLEAIDDDVSLPFNSVTRLSISDLLANDKPTYPTDILTVSGFSEESRGIKELNRVGDEVQLFIDGFVNNDPSDPVTFDYTVNDNHGSSDSATVTVTPNNVITGTSGDDSLEGTDKLDIIVGKEGNDTFARSVGSDILLGGDNEDLFLFDPSTAAGIQIKGGSETDTLSFDGAQGKTLDLIQNSILPDDQKLDLQGIEKIDLSGSNNQVRLSIKDVLEISDSNTLTIEGDASSFVNSVGEGWKNEGIEPTGLYNSYTGGDTELATLLVSVDITSQFIS
jgi:hypothetical protein